MEIESNVVYEHLLDSKKKIIVEQGGTRSGKTYNILLWIIFSYCTNHRNKIITICRKTFPSLRATVMRDFFEILKKYSMYSEVLHNKSSSEYMLYNNLVEFISLDQPTKVRGRKRDLLFINESSELNFEDWQQLIFRTNGRIILDYNPSDEYSWIYDKVLSREDVDFFITTYKDNLFLDKTIVKEIERLRETDMQYWQIYGLGQKAISKSIIFTYSESEVPEDATLISHGIDYGYTNDSTALVAVYKKDYSLYIKELLYRTMMTSQDIHKEFKNLKLEGRVIYAESSEPRLNDFLRRSGWNIRPTLKGKDSIVAGIDLLKRYKLFVTPDSKNLIHELRNYKWSKDKTEKLTNIPIDKNNDLLDALRYATFNILSKPNFGKYTIR